jgi:signal peptide peptidase SppA
MRLGLYDILTNIWFINESAAEAYFPLVYAMFENPLSFQNAPKPQDETKPNPLPEANLFSISSYGELSPPQSAPKGSVAIISLEGAITKNGQICGDSGTTTKANLLHRCYANSNIEGIILHITSPGGSVNAIEQIRSSLSARNKPVVSYIDELAASCGYWIASMSDEIVVKNERTRLGSIGAYVPFANFRKFYEKQGIEIRDIYSSYSTLKNKAFKDALEGNDAALIQEIDEQVAFFFSDVKAGRPALDNNPDKRIFQGALFYGNEAVANGMADMIGDWNTAKERISSLKSNYKKAFYV